MKKLKPNTLVVCDDDFECTKRGEERTLDDIVISKLSFSLFDLEKFDLIIYKGKLGIKLLRTRGI